MHETESAADRGAHHDSPRQTAGPTAASVAIALVAFTFLIPGICPKPVRANDDPKPEPPAAATPSLKARIGDVAWLEGRWRGKFGDDDLEEHWSGPKGDGMIGMFRWVKVNRVWMYELLAITEENDSLVLRFKHFDRGLVGWEDNDKPLTFDVTQLDDRKVVFTCREDPPWTLTYHRVADDSLKVFIDRNVDGKTSRQELAFQRAAE